MADYTRAPRGHQGRYDDYGHNDDYYVYDDYDDGYYDGSHRRGLHTRPYEEARDHDALTRHVDRGRKGRVHDSSPRGRRGWRSPSSPDQRLQHAQAHPVDRQHRHGDTHAPGHHGHRRRHTQSPRRDRDHRGHQRQHRRRAASDTRSDDRMAHAAKSGLQAAVLEAVRVHRRPGEWDGDKGARVVTAGVGAAVTDAVADMARDHPRDRHPVRHKVEDLAGGWLATQLVHGSADDMGRRRR